MDEIAFLKTLAAAARRFAAEIEAHAQGGPAHGTGQPRAPQTPPQQPASGTPRVPVSCYPSAILDELVGFGKFKDRTWRGMLSSDAGRKYLHWLVNAAVKDPEKPSDPQNWSDRDGAKKALWVLNHGEAALSSSPTTQTGGYDDVPF